MNLDIYVKVGTDKPLARLYVVRRLSVDKGQLLRSGILDTSLSLRVLRLKSGLTQELNHFDTLSNSATGNRLSRASGPVPR